MAGPAYQPYAPLNVLKPVADDLWVVDGPEIRMAFPGGAMPFPTRCTVIRLPDGGLWVHSPTELTDALATAIEGLGPVRHLVAPSSLHWWWIGEWKARWPDALAWAAPRVRDKAAGRFKDWDADLGDIAPAAWSGVIEQGLAHSLVTDEVVFFHLPSRSLILTDLIENFEPRRLAQPWRTLTRLFGAADPHGSAPYDMRLAFWPYRKRLRALIDRMLALHPRRVILAHGRGYEDDAEAELRRAFGWLRWRARSC